MAGTKKRPARGADRALMRCSRWISGGDDRYPVKEAHPACERGGSACRDEPSFREINYASMQQVSTIFSVIFENCRKRSDSCKSVTSSDPRPSRQPLAARPRPRRWFRRPSGGLRRGMRGCITARKASATLGFSGSADTRVIGRARCSGTAFLDHAQDTSRSVLKLSSAVAHRAGRCGWRICNTARAAG